MIVVEHIPKKIIEEAERKAKMLGSLKNSITHGSGNVAGYIGQILVSKYLKGYEEDTYNYDVIKDGIRYEVKTKRCTSKPLPSYECSVTQYNSSQKCDYYVFVRILNDYSKAWILGKKTPVDYFKESTSYKKGDIDPKSHFGWKFKGDCYNLEIAKLDKIENEKI